MSNRVSNDSLRTARDQRDHRAGAHLPEGGNAAQHAAHDVDRTRSAGLVTR